MDKMVDFLGNRVRLHSYQAASKAWFNYSIEVYPEAGKETPDWNRFRCGFGSLRKATNAMRRTWGVIKHRERRDRRGTV